MIGRPLLSVVIPAYNEAASLMRCVSGVRSKLQALGVTAEILIVDDASRDATGAIAEGLAAQDHDVRVFHHLVNQGIGGGFVTGVSEARGAWLILIPADLALDPDELRKYLQAARDADIVVGNRSDLGDYSWFRRLVHRANIRLIQLLFGMKERQFQYISLYRLEVLRQLDIEYARSAFFLAEILVKAKALGRRLVEVQIRYLPRAGGRATGAQWKLIVGTVRDIFHFWLRWMWLGPVAASQRRESGNAP